MKIRFKAFHMPLLYIFRPGKIIYLSTHALPKSLPMFFLFFVPKNDGFCFLDNPPLRSVEVAPSAYDPLEHQTAQFDNLKKFETYNITIFGFTSAGSGPRSPAIQVTTLEDFPGPVQSLHITNIRDRTLDVSWSVPESPNGIITGYTVECAQLDTLTNSTAASRVFRFPDLKSFTVTELTPQTNYLIKVYASTTVGDGEVRIARIQSSVPPSEQQIQTVEMILMFKSSFLMKTCFLLQLFLVHRRTCKLPTFKPGMQPLGLNQFVMGIHPFCKLTATFRRER